MIKTAIKTSTDDRNDEEIEKLTKELKEVIPVSKTQAPYATKNVDKKG